MTGMYETNVKRNRQKIRTSGGAIAAINFPEVQLAPQAVMASSIRKVNKAALGCFVIYGRPRSVWIGLGGIIRV